MNENAVNLINITSRDIGNLMSKELVERGKEVLKNDSPDGYVDYGNLPSKTLSELGKQTILNDLNEKK